MFTVVIKWLRHAWSWKYREERLFRTKSLPTYRPYWQHFPTPRVPWLQLVTCPSLYIPNNLGNIQWLLLYYTANHSETCTRVHWKIEKQFVIFWYYYYNNSNLIKDNFIIEHGWKIYRHWEYQTIWNARENI